jgi:hypothetical protein
MPIHFFVDPQLQLVRATYVGVITLVDLAVHVHRLVDAGLLQRPRLIDARHAMLQLSHEDVRIMAELMKTLREQHGSAPVAFVSNDEPSYEVAEAYQHLGAGANPEFAAFPGVEAAEAWLELLGARSRRELRLLLL